MSLYFRELFPSNKTIKFRTDFRNTIYDLMLHRKWEQTTSDADWNLCWSEKDWINENYDSLILKNNQYINHFRNYYELTRKDLLAKNIKRLKKQNEKLKNKDDMNDTNDTNIIPLTFVLPLEYKLFSEEYKKKQNVMWIMKPIGKSQGKGIFLFDKISQIKEWNVNKNKVTEDKDKPEQYIVQEYITNPLLIGGKKFDIRLYVLITSYYPLTIYLYRNGFARFSHTYFRNEKNNMNDITMHLTNVSIQKFAEGYDDNIGGKWFIRELFLYLSSRYGYNSIMKLIQNIENCIIQSFLAVHKIIINDKHCFELYGFDILIDNNLKPWLIEVNSSPSFSSNTKDDYTLKFNLLDELMTLINIENYNLPPSNRIGDFDCIYKNGEKINPGESLNLFSYLGANPSGTEHLKSIAKTMKLKSNEPINLQKKTSHTK